MTPDTSGWTRGHVLAGHHGIFDDGIGEAARRLRREHVEVALLVDARRPRLRLAFLEVVAEGGSFRVGHFGALDEGERLDQLHLDLPPHVGRERGDLAHQVIEVEIGVIAEKLLAMVLHAPCACWAGPPPRHTPSRSAGFLSSQATSASDERAM